MSPVFSTGIRVITVAAVFGLATGVGFAQGRSGVGGTPPATGGGSTTGNTPGTVGPSTSTGTPSSLPGNTGTSPNAPVALPQPIFVSGRVMREDGTPPGETVTIERVCGGSARAEGYTDSRGYFGIELGKDNGVLQDASETAGHSAGSGNPFSGGQSSLTRGGIGGATMGSDMRLINCELRAKLSGYRSQTVSLANRRPMDNPDVGVILLHRLGPSEGNTVSASSLSAPKDARKAFDKGQDALKKKKPEEAMKDFERAIELYRGYATAWFELGRLQIAAGDRYTARGSFGEALKADPKYVAPYVEIAALDMDEKKWREVVEVTDQASRLDAFDYPQVFFLNAVANYNLQNFEESEKNLRQAERLDTRHVFPKIQHLMGLILARKQDYAGAADHLRDYLKLAPDASDSATVRTQLERLEKLASPTAQSAPKQDQ